MFKKTLLIASIMLSGYANANTCKVSLSKGDDPTRFGEEMEISVETFDKQGRIIKGGKQIKHQVNFDVYADPNKFGNLGVVRNGQKKSKSQFEIGTFMIFKLISDQPEKIEALPAGKHAAEITIDVTCASRIID